MIGHAVSADSGAVALAAVVDAGDAGASGAICVGEVAGGHSAGTHADASLQEISGVAVDARVVGVALPALARWHCPAADVVSN